MQVNWRLLPKPQRYQHFVDVYHLQNDDLDAAAAACKVSRGTIRNALDWEAAGRPPPPRMGRPPKLTLPVKMLIFHATLADPTIGGNRLSVLIYHRLHVNVGKTVINEYRKKLSFSYRPRVPYIPLSLANKLARTAFARNFLAAGPLLHRHMVFSDEKWFYRESPKSYVWKLDGWVYPGVMKRVEAHPEKVMIWAAIGWNFKSRLVFLTKNVTSEVYWEECLIGSDLMTDANRVFGDQNWFLQQDNAAGHVSNDTLATIDELGIRLLEEWPPYSPDLNVIENVWAIMAYRVNKAQPKSKRELQQEVLRVWFQLALSTVNGLVDSFPARLQECIRIGGFQVRKY